MTALKKGSIFQIKSYKHNGTLHRTWLENVLLHESEDAVIGTNHHTKVIEANKREWTTEEQALFYFHKHYWFNIIYLFHKDTRYFYCNISSPFTYRNNILTYVDYDLDIVVNSDFSYQVLDEDEYELNKQLMNYSDNVNNKVKESVTTLKKWIKDQHDPFNDHFINYWKHEANNMFK